MLDTAPTSETEAEAATQIQENTSVSTAMTVSMVPIGKLIEFKFKNSRNKISKEGLEDLAVSLQKRWINLNEGRGICLALGLAFPVPSIWKPEL